MAGRRDSRPPGQGPRPPRPSCEDRSRPAYGRHPLVGRRPRPGCGGSSSSISRGSQVCDRPVVSRCTSNGPMSATAASTLPRATATQAARRSPREPASPARGSRRVDVPRCRPSRPRPTDPSQRRHVRAPAACSPGRARRRRRPRRRQLCAPAPEPCRGFRHEFDRRHPGQGLPFEGVLVYFVRDGVGVFEVGPGEIEAGGQRGHSSEDERVIGGRLELLELMGVLNGLAPPSLGGRELATHLRDRGEVAQVDGLAVAVARAPGRSGGSPRARPAPRRTAPGSK